MPDYNPCEIIEGTPVGMTELAFAEISDVTTGGIHEFSWKNLNLNLQSKRTPGAIHGKTPGKSLMELHKESPKDILKEP